MVVNLAQTLWERALVRGESEHQLRRLARLAVAATMGALLAGAMVPSASAAPAPNVTPQASGKTLADLQAQRQAIFKQILADPGNVPLTLKYAELSSEVGDLEGAISALERLLIVAPQVAEINYQLGILYMRLGSFGQASTDFQAAMAAPDATPDLKASAARYIAVADKQQVGDYIVGSFVPGVRYQTNANGGALSNSILLNGIPFELSQSAMADPDYNAYFSAVIHASHDLQDQGDRVNLDVNFYASKYEKHDELNTLAAEVQAGPVLDLGRIGLKGATLGLYGIGSAVQLGGAPYLYVLGAGGVLTMTPTEATQLQTRFEYRYEDYMNTPDRPTASDLTGARMRLTQGGQVQANDWLRLSGSGYVERKNGATAMRTDWEAGLSAGATVAFGSKDNQLPPVTLDLQLGLAGRLYDAPDPVFSSTDVRTDKSAYVQAALNIPVAEHVAASVIAAYSRQISSYDLYTFDDASLSLALTTSF
jgi:tetratricopeptide (TPR) repeat protein